MSGPQAVNSNLLLASCKTVYNFLLILSHGRTKLVTGQDLHQLHGIHAGFLEVQPAQSFRII